MRAPAAGGLLCDCDRVAMDAARKGPAFVAAAVRADLGRGSARKNLQKIRKKGRKMRIRHCFF
jgi:hypothetical protein